MTSNQTAISLGAIILAAGASSRMGKPKLLLPWGRTTVLGHLIEQWQELCAYQITVVCSVGDKAIGAELDRLGFPAANRITNPRPERGMFSSIQCAAAWGGWNASVTHLAIVLGDQPHLRRETLSGLLDSAAAYLQSVCQPSRSGRPRHPVVLPVQVFKRLPESSAENLKQFLQNDPSSVALCELDDPGLDFDMDTPADYEKTLRLFQESAG
jgi:molybdenum cofactor cytidylyltransferase